MSKLDVASLAKKLSPAPSEDDIISAAPVGSNQPIETTPNNPTANRNKKKEIKVNDYELSILKQAAATSGATLSTFIRMAALKESKRVLAS